MEMETNEINVAIDKMRYTQLILHTTSEHDFQELIKDSHVKCNSNDLYFALLYILYDLNDQKKLSDETLKDVCLLMNCEGLSFDEVIRRFTNRATGNHIILSCSETKQAMQSLLFLTKTTTLSNERILNTYHNIKGLTRILLS